MDQLKITVYDRAPSVRAWDLKRLFRRKGYALELVDVTGAANSRLREIIGSETAPQVFIDGRLVHCEV